MSDLERWTSAALLPVELRLAEQKKQLVTRLESIERIRTAATTAQAEIDVLSRICERMTARRNNLLSLSETLGLDARVPA